MSTISHRSTAKAAIRNLVAIHGKSGTLSLLKEVFEESLPSRRGRPTRDQAITRLVTNTLGAILPEVLAGEEKIATIADLSDDE